MQGWERQAACRNEDPVLFFGPVGTESRRDHADREAVAKRICAACPVIDPCREVALASGELYGVWGGLGEYERRHVARARVGADRRAG